MRVIKFAKVVKESGSNKSRRKNWKLLGSSMDRPRYNEYISFSLGGQKWSLE